jgi:hypothetical protein
MKRSPQLKAELLGIGGRISRGAIVSLVLILFLFASALRSRTGTNTDFESTPFHQRERRRNHQNRRQFQSAYKQTDGVLRKKQLNHGP